MRWTVLLLLCTLDMTITACGDNDTDIESCANLPVCTSDCPLEIERQADLSCQEEDPYWNLVLDVKYTITNLSDQTIDKIILRSQFKGLVAGTTSYQPPDDFMYIHQAILEYYKAINDLGPGKSTEATYRLEYPSSASSTEIQDLQACIPGNTTVVMNRDSISCP